MPDKEISSPPRRHLPLAFRFSLILMLASVLPLLLIVGISEYTARPVLINQADQTMATDAQTRIQEIDAYLQERLSDVATTSAIPTLGIWVVETPAERIQNQDETGQGAMQGGEFRNKNYLNWSIFDSGGNLLDAYPQPSSAQQETASLSFWRQEMEADRTGQPMVSPVYYDTTIHKAFVDIYSPVYDQRLPHSPFVAFLRVKLSLDSIWGVVEEDKGIANSGSAFILDQNGVRIADTYGRNLFTSVAPLPSAVQQQIAAQDWYGTNKSPVVQANTQLADVLKSAHSPNHLTLTPYGQTQMYQAGISKSSILPWTYVVISPSSVVTQVADQQLWTTVIGALILLALAALIGVLVSNRISRPIMHSVAQLRENSEALDILAQKQQSASNEQSWVIDSVQVGLKSVQYYTDATRIAAHKLGEIGTRLMRSGGRQQRNVATASLGLQEVIVAAYYIEAAARYQTDSSQKLITAIKVASQVNEQLTNGSISATEAATQLKGVVDDLRNVVGQ